MVDKLSPLDYGMKDYIKFYLLSNPGDVNGKFL